jgi:hypothetical protein
MLLLTITWIGLLAWSFGSPPSADDDFSSSAIQRQADGSYLDRETGAVLSSSDAESAVGISWFVGGLVRSACISVLYAIAMIFLGIAWFTLRA